MPQIEVDFEVFKQLTSRRATESMTNNNVIRLLLKMPASANRPKRVPEAGSQPWIVSDTSFPAGSEFTADYKGKSYVGVVREGKLEVEGKRFSTPSAAAMSITGGGVNGWRFWKCKVPTATQFVSIERLRGKTN